MHSLIHAWPMTPMVKRLLIATGGVWLLFQLLRRIAGDALFLQLALTPAQIYPDLHLWQLITWMWLHDLNSWSHLLFNMLFLWMFGGTLEQHWGAKAFLKFYLICGVGSGLVVWFVGWLFSPLTPTVGSSGAVYGLVAAWAISFPNRIVYLFGVFPVKGRHFAAIPIGIAVLDMIVGGSNISHSAHIGGLIIGALLVTGLWRPRRFRSKARYYYLKHKLKVIEGSQKQKSPTGHHKWN